MRVHSEQHNLSTVHDTKENEYEYKLSEHFIRYLLDLLSLLLL